MKKKDRRRLRMLCDISELTDLISGSENIQSFFQETVELVARHMDAEECSIYLFDDISRELVLEASTGLIPDTDPKIRIKVGEGLVGKAFEQHKSLRVRHVNEILQIGTRKPFMTDSYASFLAVPIARGSEKIGVLIVQRRNQKVFDKIDVMAMRAIASQLAGAVGNARLLIRYHQLQNERLRYDQIPKDIEHVKGEVASQGYAFAQATVFDTHEETWFPIGFEAETTHSLNEFHQAIQATTAQLQDFQHQFSQRLPESATLIFTAHLMILKDERFVGEMENLILSGESPVQAIRKVAQHYVDLFGESPHLHIKEKAQDVRDLAKRIMKNLIQGDTESQYWEDNRIVITRELYPSDVLRLASEDIKGIILVGGGVTAHVSILTRSVQIPMIIAHHTELLKIPEGTPVLMDAEKGDIYIQPSDDIILEYEELQQNRLKAEKRFKKVAAKTFTRDGNRVRIYANINLLSDLMLAKELKAEGVGLYRSEIPFLFRSALPSEEEQYVIYKKLFDGMPGKSVTVRTLDVGGDKLLAYSDFGREANPAMGLRAIRFSLRNKQIFHQQLRAILRAAADAEKPRIMFPMISSLDEFRDAKKAVDICMQALDERNLHHHHDPSVGVLVEIPSVLEIIDELIAESDFLSIGTNDFVQYMLAVDRTNVCVAEYYRPESPSVLRSLAKFSKAAIAQDKELSVCGEMARETEFIPFLLGIGIQNFSVYPSYLPAVQTIVGKFDMDEAKIYANELLAEATQKGVCTALKRLTHRHNLDK